MPGGRAGRGDHGRPEPGPRAAGLPPRPIQDRHAAAARRPHHRLRRLELQPGDDEPEPFSFLTERIDCRANPCWITYTNAGRPRADPGEPAPGPDVHRPDPVDRAALLPVDRDQGRPLRRQGPAPVVPRARRTADPRGLRQRALDQPAARRAGRHAAADPGPGAGRDPPLRLRHRVRLRAARAVEAVAGDEARGGPVPGRAGQRHHRLRRGGRPGTHGRGERGAGARRARSRWCCAATRPTSA